MSNKFFYEAKTLFRIKIKTVINGVKYGEDFYGKNNLGTPHSSMKFRRATTTRSGYLRPFSATVHRVWASQIWAPKLYKVKKIIAC